MLPQIHIIVADGRVQSVIGDEKYDVEVIDFDSDSFDEKDQANLANYVDELRESKFETIC